MADPYAVDARYYDLIHGRGGADIGLWLSFAGRTERPVLEVGTGTGRIALALARAGHSVTAIDPSRAMLTIAREHAEADAIDDVTFVEGAATELTLEAGHYGLALLPADVFLYCADAAAQLALLSALGRVLAFNGSLALDLPGPAAWLDASTNGQPLLAFSGPFAEGEWLDAWHVHEDDLARQRRTLHITYERTGADGSVRRAWSEHTLRYVYPFEAEALLAAAGLAPVGIYGDYDLGPLTNESHRMILIARPGL